MINPKKRSLSSQIGWIGFGNLINALINVLLLPYLARALSVELYGTYGQVLMIVGIFNVLFAFGLSKLVYQQLNRQEKGAALNVIAAAFFLGLIAAYLIFILSEPISMFFENKLLAYLLKLYAFSLLFTFVSEILKSVLTHFYLTHKVALISLVHNFIRVTSIFVAINFYDSIELLFIFLLIVEGFQLILTFIFCPKTVLSGKLNLKELSTNLRNGFPLALSGAASILLVQTDGLMISRMLGTEEYAIFRMGAVPIPFLFIVFSSVISVTIAEVNKQFAEGNFEKLISIKRKASSAIAYITYPTLIFLLVFSKPFINYYLGPTYEQSAIVFLVYNLLLFLRINDYRDVLIAANKGSLIFKIDLAVLTFNGILNYFLISRFGLIGAAIASICSFYFLSALLQFKTIKFLKIPYFSFFRIGRLLKMILICSILSLGSLSLFSISPSIYTFVVAALLYILLSYILLLKTGVVEIQLVITYSKQIKMLKPLVTILSRLR